MVERKTPTCVACRVEKCRYPEREGEVLDNCPMVNYADVRQKTIEEGWSQSELKKVNVACEKVLSKTYDERGARTSRLEELMEYAGVMGCRKLGLAFCVGLFEEARLLADILEKNGFEVVSVSCMAGGPSRESLGVEQSKYLGKVTCNPLMQAEVLNREETDLNIMLGLCIGHDILFLKASKADVTPFIVKDRLLCHNPAAALYLSKGYYHRRLYPSRL